MKKRKITYLQGIVLLPRMPMDSMKVKKCYSTNFSLSIMILLLKSENNKLLHCKRLKQLKKNETSTEQIFPYWEVSCANCTAARRHDSSVVQRLKTAVKCTLYIAYFEPCLISRWLTSQETKTFSKSTIERLEKNMKYVQSHQ